MESMVERVAKALADKQGVNWDFLQTNGTCQGIINMYLRLASTAIKVMSEPTENMTELGGLACVYVCDDGRNGVNRANAYEAYVAMIKAALEEE